MTTQSAPQPETGGLPVIRPAPLSCSPSSTQGLTLISDLHLGATNCDLDLLTRELETAREHGDRILLGGDVFDLILPSDKKRYAPSALHPRLRGREDLLNAVVEWGVELLAPYADLIDGIGLGNHETAVERQHSYDCVRALAEALGGIRTDKRAPHYLGYTAYVDYRLHHEGKRRGRYLLWYHHGKGRSTGTSALTALARKASMFQADLYWSGHAHTRANCAELMIHCGKNGKPVAREVRCVLTGSYLVPYGHQSQESIKRDGRRSNYAADAALAPHSLGGARVLLSWERPGFPSDVQVIQ